jgi:hypothetical protein
MASGDQHTFALEAPITVPPRRLTSLELRDPVPGCPHAHVDGTGVHFDAEGWFEVLLRVAWATDDDSGTRFCHTKIPDQEPLHSEAISAAVLAQLSGGQQLLRGNSLFGPDRTTCLVLEVWHDAEAAVKVDEAELILRELVVPWVDPAR